jgi:hypothetical protein
VTVARLVEVDDLIVALRARVPQNPSPTLLRVGEPLGGAALATGEPYAGGEGNYVDHKIRIDRTPD